MVGTAKAIMTIRVQETTRPGFTVTQSIIQAQLQVHLQERKVIL